MTAQTQSITFRRDHRAITMMFLLAALSPAAWWIADHAAYPELSYSEAIPIAMLGTSALLSAIGIVVTPKYRWGVAISAAFLAFTVVAVCGAISRPGTPTLGLLPATMAIFGALCGPLFVRGATGGLRFSIATLVWMMVGFVATTQTYAYNLELDRTSARFTEEAPLMVQRLEKVTLPMMFRDARVVWREPQLQKNEHGRFASYKASGILEKYKGELTADVRGGILSYEIWLKAPEKYKLQKFETSADRLAYAKYWLHTIGLRENGYRLRNLKSWNWGYAGPRAAGQVQIELGNGKNVWIRGVINPDWM